MQKFALITGACGGIGREACRRLAQLSYQLILVDVSPDLVELAASYQASYHFCDFTNAAALSHLCAQIENDFAQNNQQLAVAFINAGIVLPGLFVEQSYEDIGKQMQINCLSAMQIIRACSANMRQAGGGHIVVTVSMGALIALTQSAVYSASKFALRGLLSALYDELAQDNIFISGIYPSAVDTNMLRFEAQNGGNVLNYLSTPHSVESIGKALVRALKTKKLEIYIPYLDSIGARIICSFPWLLRYVYPLLYKMGERGRLKYIQQMTANSQSDTSNQS